MTTAYFQKDNAFDPQCVYLVEQLANLQGNGQFQSYQYFQTTPDGMMPPVALCSPPPWMIKPDPEPQHLMTVPCSPIAIYQYPMANQFATAPIQEQPIPVQQQPPMILGPASPMTPYPMQVQRFPRPITRDMNRIDTDQSDCGYWPTPPPVPAPTPIPATPTMVVFPTGTGLFQFPAAAQNGTGTAYVLSERTFRSEPNTPSAPRMAQGYRRNSCPGRSATGGCNFCKRNQETREYYQAHQLKDETGKVLCPILHAYTCKICGATGDWAHTESYCPERPKDATKSFTRTPSNRMATGKVKGQKCRNGKK